MIRSRAFGVWPRFMGAAVLIVGLSVQAVGAESNRPTNGPSLAETKAWLESDGVALMQTTKVLRTDHSTGVTWVAWSGVRVSNLTLSGCGLTYLHEIELRRVSATGETETEVEHSRLISVPLRDLDVDSILVRGDSALTDEPTAEVQLRLSAGATYTMTSYGVGRGSGTTGGCPACQGRS